MSFKDSISKRGAISFCHQLVLYHLLLELISKTSPSNFQIDEMQNLVNFGTFHVNSWFDIMEISRISCIQITIQRLNSERTLQIYNKHKTIKQTCLSTGILAFCFAIATARESPPIASTRPRVAASLPVQTLPWATSSMLSTCTMIIKFQLSYQ